MKRKTLIMASLIISRNDQLLNRILPVHIYSDSGWLGQLKAGKTEKFELDESIDAIHAKNGLGSSQKVLVSNSGDDSCVFTVKTHPAIGLIRTSFLGSILFLVALWVMYAESVSWLMLLMFGFPILLLLVVGVVFCRSHYFVIKEVSQG